jgi:phage/plasmid-like protein (TIGR03299 family)
MSHNLNYNNGRVSFAYNAKNGLPWHALGQSVEGAMTWREAMQKAGLDYKVSKRQLSICINGIWQLVESYGIFRDDNDVFLGAVGDKYTTIQNEKAFDFVDSLLETSGAHYDTAGALGNGERIFVSATIPYSLAPNRAPTDKTNCFLMFTTSHDGTLSATAKLTTVRVVCQNTLNMAMQNSAFGTLKIRHTESGNDRLDKAKTIFQGVTQTVESLKEKFNLLAERKPNREEIHGIMDKLFGKDWKESTQKKNQIEKIAFLFDNNDNGAFPEIKGSAYSLLQSVTNYVDHDRTIRRTDSTKNMSENAIRTQSALFGSGEEFKTEALEVILSATAHSNAMPEAPKYYQAVSIPEKKTALMDIMNMVQV